MAREKNEGTNYFSWIPPEVLYVILEYISHNVLTQTVHTLNHATDNALAHKTPTALDHPTFNPSEEDAKQLLVSQHTLFGKTLFLEDRIKSRLSHYTALGRWDMLGKLAELRPDLIPDIIEQKLFALAGIAQQNEMEYYLKMFPRLFYSYGRIKDISGVYPVINAPNVIGITLFQHALWSGDIRHMCTMMLNCLPPNDEGEAIRIELIRQYNELMEKGVVYERNGVTYNENSFNIQACIDLLQTAITRRTSVLERQVRDSFPAIIRHHYCNPDELFWDSSDFTSQELLRVNYIYDVDSDKERFWNTHLEDTECIIPSIGLDKYGSHMSGSCVINRYVQSVTEEQLIGYMEREIVALQALEDERSVLDIPALQEQLQQPVQNREEVVIQILENLSSVIRFGLPQPTSREDEPKEKPASRCSIS